MASESNLRYRTAWLGIGWVLVAIVVYLSVTTLHVVPDVEHSDKGAHLLAYGVLMLWFAQIVTARSGRVTVALCLIGLGLSMELVQALLPHRMFSLSDALANALGVAMGWSLAPPRTFNALLWLEGALGLQKKR